MHPFKLSALQKLIFHCFLIEIANVNVKCDIRYKDLDHLKQSIIQVLWKVVKGPYMAENASSEGNGPTGVEKYRTNCHVIDEPIEQTPFITCRINIRIYKEAVEKG